MASLARRRREPLDIWPGFVDALATLLILIIFLLMIFMVAQFYLNEVLLGRDKTLDRLNGQISELADMLSLERATSEELRSSLTQLSSELQSSVELRDHLGERLLSTVSERDALAATLAQLQTEFAGSEEKVAALAEDVSAREIRLAALMVELRTTQSALAERETRIRFLDDDFAVATAEIASRRQQIAALIADLAARNTRIEALDADLAASTNRINALDADLAARDSRIAALDADLAERGSRIVALDADLAARDSRIVTLDADLAARIRQIVELDTDLAARDADLTERASRIAALDTDLAERDSRIDALDTDLAARDSRIETLDAALATRARRIDEFDIALVAVRLALAEQAARADGLSADLEDTRAALTDGEDRLDLLLTALEAARERLARDQQANSSVKQISDEALAQVEILNMQLAIMRQQIARLAVALEASEAASEDQQVEIVSLGQRLNAALASRVEELARYRSEFFGRLREVLGNREDIHIVGDRFVFQSDVLFASGSAELDANGARQIGQLGRTLIEIAASIPSEINWILRVDGHTDRVPIATFRYPTNWALSTARAVSVVKFLVEAGVPAERLAAAGFGEFQPLDVAEGPAAYARNRRIELRLDQR